MKNPPLITQPLHTPIVSTVALGSVPLKNILMPAPTTPNVTSPFEGAEAIPCCHVLQQQFPLSLIKNILLSVLDTIAKQFHWLMSLPSYRSMRKKEKL